MEQFKLPFFDLDDAEAWGEHQDVFEEYKKSVLLMQDYLKRLIQYHKHLLTWNMSLRSVIHVFSMSYTIFIRSINK